MTQITQEEWPREKWGAMVGQLILFFGDIENVTYLALLQLPKDKIFETTSSLSFGKRVDLVLELIKGHPEISEELSANFSTKLRAAKKLSEIRNIVAHSPLMMNVYVHPTEGWTHNEMALGNARNNENNLSFDELSVAVVQVETLAKELYELYSEIYKCTGNQNVA